MRAFLTLTRRELTSHFVSLNGYAVIAGVQLLLGQSFWTLLDALNGKPFDMPVTEKFFDTGFFWLVLLLVTPMITMRTYALERATGTFETLMTTPISEAQVVLAKFCGALAFFVIAWLPAVAYPFLLQHYAEGMAPVDAGPVAATFLGIALLGGFYMALGCFASSLTRSQIVAAMTTFAIGLGLFLLGYLSQIRPPEPGWQAQLLTHLSMLEHMRDFSRGVVDTRHVFFYLSLTTFFLFLTLRVLESRRWK
ncbi:MAG: hypothetical protein EXS29_02375 [Pedosphaera sp.]|nr:hypothetical protein [Pedosphaera sp.]MST00143.1 hypothetical protein [Pedosphaera sp.]